MREFVITLITQGRTMGGVQEDGASLITVITYQEIDNTFYIL